MTNGLGAMIGAYGSGYVIDLFRQGDHIDWHSVWFVFSAYALVVAILFMILFKYKHDREAMEAKLQDGVH